MKERYCRFGVLAFFASANKYFKFINHYSRLLTLLGVLVALPSWGGQPPGFIWSTPASGLLIGVDAQTNVYAEPLSTDNGIITLNSAGVVLQTNTMCPFSGLARRDAAGNYYFAGTITAPLNFGNGIIVSNGPAAIAKYNSAGSIVWAYGFGAPPLQYDNFGVTDLEVDPSGVAYVTWTLVYEEDMYAEWVLQSFSDSTNTTTYLPSPFPGFYVGGYYGADARVKLTSPTNGYVVTVAYSDSESAGAFSSFVIGFGNILTNWYYPADTYPQYFTPTHNLSPIPDGAGNVYNAEYQTLTKRTSSGALIWSVNTGDSTLHCVAGDYYGGVHVADNNGLLARYDSAGNLAWSTNLEGQCTAMIVDSQGNRFISDQYGVVSRLQPEAIYAPVITNAPQGGEIFAGANVTFSVGASGFTPFSYSWLYQSNSLATGTLIAGATYATLTLTNATGNQSGLYSVIVSNLAGSATSAPATLRVKSVELFFGNEMLTNASYYFATGTPPTLTVESAFTNGEIFYTLDGSTPNFTSIPYTGPFVLSNSATVNAIGYSADFSQSDLADTVIATIPPQYTISLSTAGGGTIDLFPLGGDFTNTNISYTSNVTITATANPAAGFSFLYWQGASSSMNPTITLPSNQNVSLIAVFGTTLSTTVAGYGQVLLAPPGGLYPYGTVLRLEALPQPGNYFGAWGNAASGSVNPLYLTVTNPTPTVSSIFAATPTNESALTVLVTGQGHVGQNPAGNAFATSQSVTLTATPNTGQSFIGWSGSATSTQNPLTVAMTQSRVITAHFTGQSVVLSTAGANGFSSQGFQFSVTGDPLSVYEIQTSSNLLSWQYADIVTNSTGSMQLTYPASAGTKAAFYRVVVTQ